MPQTRRTLTRADQPARNLRALRTAAGMSQAALAQVFAEHRGSNFPQQSVDKIERGLRALRADEAMAAAAALGVSVSALLSYDTSQVDELATVLRSRRDRQKLLDQAAEHDQAAEGFRARARLHDDQAKGLRAREAAAVKVETETLRRLARIDRPLLPGMPDDDDRIEGTPIPSRLGAPTGARIAS